MAMEAKILSWIFPITSTVKTVEGTHSWRPLPRFGRQCLQL